MNIPFDPNMFETAGRVICVAVPSEVRKVRSCVWRRVSDISEVRWTTLEGSDPKSGKLVVLFAVNGSEFRYEAECSEYRYADVLRAFATVKQ